MPPPNKRRAFPDKAHEDLATWVEETVASIKQTRADVDDSFMLVDTLFALSDSARVDTETHGADLGDSLLLVDALFSLLDSAAAEVAALTARVVALEENARTAGQALTGPDAAG